MARRFHEITYTVPLSTPLQTEANVAPCDSDFRLIVMPGTPCNKMLFSRFLRVAPANIEVVVISRLGYGKDHHDAYPDFDDQLAAVKPFLSPANDSEFEDKPVIMMGVSYGGELALKAALDFPEIVKGVVSVAALIDEPHDYAKHLEAVGGNPGVEPFVPNRWKKVRAEITGRRAQIGPLLSKLEKLLAPVEILHGDFDAIVPQSNAHTLMGILPNATLDIVPGGTHYLELQYPRRIYEAVQRVYDRSALIN